MTQKNTQAPPHSAAYRVAAITGAGSGIGRALAAGLAVRGINLALSDISEEGLEETRRSLAYAGVKILTTPVDVADRSAMEAWAEQVIEEFGQVNMIFNNAGTSVVNSAERISLKDFEWLMGVNFWGVVNGTQVFLPHLKQQSEAHIINTSSILGIVGIAGQAAYSASKFAVRGFTEALAQELAETHVRVSCVMPGGVKTRILEKSRYYAVDNESPTHEEAAAEFRKQAGLLPQEAAAIILKGIEEGSNHILVGMDAKVVALSQRIAPNRYQKIFRLLGWGRNRNHSPEIRPK